jgi:hypothetical protein
MDAEQKNLRKENLDGWLDTALRARVDAEPRMGLEDRVLARLAAEHPRATFSWMPLLAAAAVVLAVSVALIVNYSRRHTGQIAVVTPPTLQTVHNSEATPIQRSGALPDMQHNDRITAHRIARARVPEASRASGHEQAISILDGFPASAPPTQQERVLAELARSPNAKDLANFSQTLAPLKDVEISSLQIDPLDSEDSGPR